jgi:hypothetical protein
MSSLNVFFKYKASSIVRCNTKLHNVTYVSAYSIHTKSNVWSSKAEIMKIISNALYS